MKIASIGIDIGKTTFHLVALDEHGSIVIRSPSPTQQDHRCHRQQTRTHCLGSAVSWRGV